MNHFHSLSSSLKAKARNALLGNLGTAVWVCFLHGIISLILTQLAAGSYFGSGLTGLILSELLLWLIMVFVGILRYGICAVFMSLYFMQPASGSDLFLGLRENTNELVALNAFLSAIRILIMLPANLVLSAGGSGWFKWTAVLYVAALAADMFLNLVYGLSMYLLLDFPQLGARGCLRRSRMLMRSHMLERLYMELSFLPLYLLGFLSMGVATLWVNSYKFSFLASFYVHVLEENAGHDH